MGFEILPDLRLIYHVYSPFVYPSMCLVISHCVTKIGTKILQLQRDAHTRGR